MARKILLADDSVTAQNMGRKILTDAGYEVVTVNNGSAALKKIIEHKPDLIVLDVYMPGYSGLEVCQRIKENRETARIPVLLTVGKLEPFKPEEARRARADAFVVKPFEASELLAALTKLEDKVIPQPEPYKPGRFAKAVASFDRDTEAAKIGEPDEGWKARLRIPTGPPKSRDPEPDPDYTATQGKGFRDFVEPPAKKNQPGAASDPTNVERPLPAGLPHDITPEEIAAIAAAAAQLSGSAPIPSAPIPKNVPDEVAARETPAAIEAKSETAEANLQEASAEENAPVTFASSPDVSGAEPDAVSSQIPAEEPPAPEMVETATTPEEISGAAAPEPAQAITTEIQHSSEEAIAQEAQAEAQAEAAPVAEEPTPEPKLEETAAAPTAESSLPEIVSQSSEPSLPASVEVPSSDMPATAAGAAVAPTSDTADAEVMAALQTLMPTASEIEPTNGQPTKDMPLSAAAMADGVETRAHAAGPRWIAEEVSLASDEATLSLEREMEKAYAVAAVDGGPHAVKAWPDVARGSEVNTVVSEPVTQSASVMYAVASAAAGEATPAHLPPVLAPAENEISTAQESSAVEASIQAEPVASELPETMSGPTLPASATDTAAAEISYENEIVGGTEDMAANWKNIRDSIAGAAAKPAPAKEDFRAPEPVKSEPEAAAPVTASEKTAGPDPKAIASIVESVLAELRPKIVEEIARKIAESNKE